MVRSGSKGSVQFSFCRTYKTLSRLTAHRPMFRKSAGNALPHRVRRCVLFINLRGRRKGTAVRAFGSTKQLDGYDAVRNEPQANFNIKIKSFHVPNYLSLSGVKPKFFLIKNMFSKTVHRITVWSVRFKKMNWGVSPSKKKSVSPSPNSTIFMV